MDMQNHTDRLTLLDLERRIKKAQPGITRKHFARLVGLSDATIVRNLSGKTKNEATYQVIVKGLADFEAGTLIDLKSDTELTGHNKDFAYSFSFDPSIGGIHCHFSREANNSHHLRITLLKSANDETC